MAGNWASLDLILLTLEMIDNGWAAAAAVDWLVAAAALATCASVSAAALDSLRLERVMIILWLL